MKRFQGIYGILEGWINQGLYQPGERLPAERKLAALLKVNRTAIREALLLLAEKGLVEIQRGKMGGAYVKEPSSVELTNAMDLLLRLDRLSFEEVAEFREMIEEGVTTIVARNAKPEDVRLLKHHLVIAKSYIGRGTGWDDFIKADTSFHMCIAQISKNPLTVQALQATYNLQKYFNRFHNLDPRLMEDNLEDLCGIVEAIENHQPEVASRITHSHICRFNEAVISM